MVAGEQVSHAALMEAIAAGRAASIALGAPVRHLQARNAGRRHEAGRTQPAVRLELLDNDNTLTDERIDATVTEVIGALARAWARVCEARGDGAWTTTTSRASA